ncbi:signal-regulatory protein beta-2-like [Channa argus]|uniref:signal-regulatory protein beta-2-like n=1 Tax=Channa argus TaxID=215402 RepID=UPI00352246E7
MFVLWVTLLLLHQGHSLVPVITVGLDESVNLTCVLPVNGLSSEQLYWYKQKPGDNLKLIATIKKFANPQYGSEFSSSRMDLKTDQNLSSLMILRTIQEDEGMYHCAIVDWTSVWTGTYLLLKGNSQRTSNYTVVQGSTASDPVRPGDSVTLQCSLLSDSENKTCPGDHSVYWFRAGSEKSHPEIIHTDGNHQCEKRSDTVKSCVYGFSKTISSSDAGTYYCAVATCGQILFGNGTKLDFEEKRHFEFSALIIVLVVLGVSVTGNIFFICYRTPACAKFKKSPFSQERHGNVSEPQHNNPESEHDLNYAALRFSGAKATKGRRKKELKTEESVYAQVKCST